MEGLFLILYIFIFFACVFFIFYEINEVDYDFEIRRLKKIIKNKDKEIKELKKINYTVENIIKERLKEIK